MRLLVLQRLISSWKKLNQKKKNGGRPASIFYQSDGFTKGRGPGRSRSRFSVWFPSADTNLVLDSHFICLLVRETSKPAIIYFGRSSMH